MEFLRKIAPKQGYRQANIARVSLALAGITLALGTAYAQIEEYAVKAAYLYKFGLFVEWPNSAFATPTSPVNLCIAGEDPFGQTLDRLVADEKIKGRSIVVRRLKTVARNPACHILYAGGSAEQDPAEMLDTVRGSPVLTVTDSSPVLAQNAIINFVIADNRVRFNIDDAAAAQNGLTISSKLSSLALNVKLRASNEGN